MYFYQDLQFLFIVLSMNQETQADWSAFADWHNYAFQHIMFCITGFPSVSIFRMADSKMEHYVLRINQSAASTDGR